MRAFFSKRKDSSHASDASPHDPPPSLTTRRAKIPNDLKNATAASPSLTWWDGKCANCRKLMSQCLCHEAAGGPPTPNAKERPLLTVRSEPTLSTTSTKPASDKRPLLETLSGMHQPRARPRVPLKMTQDRTRERRVRESQRFSNHTVLTLSTSSSSVAMAPTRAMTVGDESLSSPSSRFTRSCPDVKWRSSSAISSTMRLAHDVDTAPPRSGPPKNLLAYDNKKPTNRFNQNHTVHTATPPLAPSTTPVVLKRSESGNTYITKPISRRRPNEDNPDYSRVWEL